MEKLISHYGAYLDQTHPLNEYPRPHFVRKSYFSFNGQWDLTIFASGDRNKARYRGKVTVPFAVESLLSGVPRDVYAPGDLLVYERQIALNIPLDAHYFTLHFEGIDYRYKVIFNQKVIGEQQGGYQALRITLPISEIKKTNQLIVEVYDDTFNQYAEKGKQSLNPGGMWYCATSGIYQSVWGEFLPFAPINGFQTTFDFVDEKLAITLDVEPATFPVIISIPRIGHEDILLEVRTAYTEIPFPHPQLWSSAHPHLYEISFRTPFEEVYGYFGIRSCKIGESPFGKAVMINDEAIFLNGVLDQGYWPESGLTPPSDAAILDDLRLIKRLGFNTTRVHMKKASPRYLYHADQLGIYVIQDVPAGGRYSFYHQTLLPTLGFKKVDDHKYAKFGRENPDNRANFYHLIETMVKEFSYSPALIIWCPFNEGWGQFDAALAYDLIKKLDPQRLIDTTSGWFDIAKSDFQSEHIYFKKIKFKLRDQRPYLLSEFGGYSYSPEGHTFHPDKMYGYKKFKTQKEWQDALVELYQTQIVPAIGQGLSGAILTQLSDVEEETNGLISYDRKALKVDEVRFRQLMEMLKF
ncbi:MAG: glycoside hydrolase family 2 TIM barrel-domain containing protein [Bacilli bacterium]|jgi:beta-galactosidase/beta-glucuronidase